jgi:hypothetical protein
MLNVLDAFTHDARRSASPASLTPSTILSDPTDSAATLAQPPTMN